MAQKRVKDYSYIKRSDISVLKATIDGKVLNVDPKTILSGTYVAGKIKPTAAKLRVAKIDPSKLREKMLKMYKDWAEDEYNSEFEKYITTDDIKKFVECGLTEEMIIAFYCGIQAVMDIKADNEFSYYKVGGVFNFRTDEDGKYIKSWVKRGIYNCQNGVYELGFKYPDFNWSSLLKKGSGTEVISTPPYDYRGKQRVDVLKLEKFVVNDKFTLIAIKSGGYSENGQFSSYTDASMRDANVPLELPNGYLAIVSRNGKELFALAKKLLSQTKGYVKDFDWLVQSKTSGAEELKEANYKFAKGGSTYAEGGEIPNGYTKELETEDFIYYIDEFGEKVLMIRKSDGSVASDNYFAENDLFERMTEIANGRELYIYLRPESKKYLSEFKDSYAEGGEIKDYFYDKLEVVKSDKPNEFGDVFYILRDKKTKKEYVVGEKYSMANNLKARGLSLRKGEVDKVLDNAKVVKGLKFFEKGGSTYARGGSLKGHGLAIGDEIRNLGEFGNIYVLNRGVVYMVDLSSGKRTMTKMSKDDVISTFEKGGNVRTMSKSDAVLYRDKTWYVTEKDGVVGITSFNQGAWGSSYPFIPISKIIQDQELTDMYGNKVFIPYSFAKGGSTYAEGGEIKMLKVGDRIKDEFGYELEVYQVDSDKVHVQAPSGTIHTYTQKDFDNGEVELFWFNKTYAEGGEINVPKANVGALLIAEKVKELAPKSFDSADTKIANRLEKKSFAQRMSETGNEEYDRDAYSASQFAKGGGIEDDYMSIARTNARESIDWDEEVRNYAGDFYDSLTGEEKDSIISEMKDNFDFQHSFAKGGVLSESKYIPREEIVKVWLKNGKVIENSWSSPIYSGLRVVKGITEREEMEAQGQTSLFKRGGTMPKYAKYISQRDIAKVYVGDEEEPKVISGRDLIGGVWYDNENTELLIATARKQGLIK